MNKLSTCIFVLIFILMSGVMIGQAQAHHVDGCVYCDANGTLVPLTGIDVTTVDTLDGFSSTDTTDSSGCFYQSLPSGVYTTYEQTLGGLPGDVTYIDPASDAVQFDITSDDTYETINWVVDSQEIPECAEIVENGCWLTAGGVKFVESSDFRMGGPPRDSFGLVVYPGCNATSADGGQVNLVAHSDAKHFIGTYINVIQCGGEPTGSPQSSVNWIEFEGTGTITEGRGNKKTTSEVFFFAKAVDRSEPNAGQDAFFLHVFTDSANPSGSTVFLYDIDGDPTTVDPDDTTGGNIQIHEKPCP